MGIAQRPIDSLITVVDDDEESRDAIALLTRALGFAVGTFASAAEFLASPAMLETSCLIADINMPGMTGVQLHRHLVTAGFTIPTILITAYPDEAVRSRALADGVIGYLTKPCGEYDLLGCVQLALQAGKTVRGH
jgi:FixJ family two-component response regulator